VPTPRSPIDPTHAIVEHRADHYSPHETDPAGERRADQPLTSINMKNPLALRRLLEFAGGERESSPDGSYGTPGLGWWI
jgi:hypothetical protein